MIKRAVVCILGATGTGKTAAALALAREFRGQVINFDSRQIYRGLAVVTAQPTSAEQSVCPHHLYGFLDPDRPMMAAAFAELVHERIADIHDHDDVPILVGGTGLYLRAILEGLADIPEIDPEIRARVLDECCFHGPQALHARLTEIDPVYAARIHPNDTQRNCRALEVFESTGRALSDWHSETTDGSRYRHLKIGIEVGLDELTPHLERRIKAMIRAGALEEVRAALATCSDPKAPGFSGIGCPEILAFLDGRMSWDETGKAWLKNTRAYAKRQMTWFRKERGVHWVRPGREKESAGMVRAFLGLS
ncbi:MAG: tRNA (adenosine(37)-N6)-dimethylallyltransferase MiaA [Deltaproteobacteria bacterium]|nr:tRNA (adenosine(37)-N6)-dimethylallyltransferase MiaA [Deltaproteobacteria bacterium]